MEKEVHVVFDFSIQTEQHPLASMKSNKAIANAAFSGNIDAVDKMNEKLPKPVFMGDFSMS